MSFTIPLSREHVCVICGKSWVSKSKNVRYCSGACAWSARVKSPYKRSCRRCGSEFESTSPRAKVCAGCRPAHNKALYKKAGDAHSYRKRYGLTLQDVQAMIDAQEGLCAICGGPPNGAYGKLVVDHCHETRKVRGLLCNKCNLMLGNAGDEPSRLRAAASYLEEHKENENGRAH